MSTKEEIMPKCPVCRRWMLDIEPRGRGVVYHRCPGCDGTWFDGGELERVLDVAVKNLDVLDDAEQGDRTCPRDGKVLWQFDYPQTYAKIDMCKRCHGVFLDRRELSEIKIVRESFGKQGRLDPHAPLTGVKGAIIRFIDDAIDQLTDFTV